MKLYILVGEDNNPTLYQLRASLENNNIIPNSILSSQIIDIPFRNNVIYSVTTIGYLRNEIMNNYTKKYPGLNFKWYEHDIIEEIEEIKDSSVDPFKAMQFAMRVHKDQLRKYTNVPYFTHLAEVAGLISTINPDNLSIAVAWLHDCMEDCGITFDCLRNNFGIHVAMGVSMLSDMEEGNRETKKRLSRERLEKCPKWIQDIKLCDLISNTSSIIMHDPKFAKVYLEEKRLLLEVLRKSDMELWYIAERICDDSEDEDDYEL